jgi:hypothetical protein
VRKRSIEAFHRILELCKLPNPLCEQIRTGSKLQQANSSKEEQLIPEFARARKIENNIPEVEIEIIK